METVDQRSFKEKFEDRKGRIKIWFDDKRTWIKNNPRAVKKALIETVIIGATAANAAVKVKREVDKARNERTVYCNDIQSRVELKHKMRPDEQFELRDRMNNGQTKFEALNEMDLIKK